MAATRESVVREFLNSMPGAEQQVAQLMSNNKPQKQVAAHTLLLGKLANGTNVRVGYTPILVRS